MRRENRGVQLGGHLRIDNALSERERKIRAAASKAAYGESYLHPAPTKPNPVEVHYLAAIEAFEAGSPTRGWDHVDRGDRSALLRLGRAMRRGGVYEPTDTLFPRSR